MIRIWKNESKTKMKLEVSPGMSTGNVMCFCWGHGTTYTKLPQSKLQNQFSDEMKGNIHD